MKDKILSALKKSVVDPNTGKTSINDQTFNAYVDIIADKITDESQIESAITPFVNVLKEFQGNINSVAAEAARNKETELKAAQNAAPQNGDGKPVEPKGDDIQALIKAGIDLAMKPLAEKLSGYEAKERQAARQNLISNKAKELGIPDWRQKEGFTIADDADEATINSYLSSVKQNIVTAGLESSNSGFSLSTPEDKAKELATDWAKNLPDA